METKRSILREVLRRTGKIEYEGEIPAVAGDPWGYRNRTQLHVEKGKIGYFEAGSHRLNHAIERYLSSPKLNEAIATLSRDLPRHRHFSTRVELFTNETDIQVHLLDPVPFTARPLFDALGPTGAIEYGEFRVSRNSFFQSEPFSRGTPGGDGARRVIPGRPHSTCMRASACSHSRWRADLVPLPPWNPE